MNDFYVYIHIHHSQGYPVIFYVGKGLRKRAFSDLRNIFWHRTVAKYGPHEVIIHKENLTEQEAFDLEVSLIKSIGRRNNGTGTLVNLTDGGEGCSGWIPTAETRAKRSASMMGKNTGPRGPLSEAHKAKMSKSTKGRKMPPEFGEHLSKVKKGKPSPLKGRERSPETVAKMKAAWANRERTHKPLSDEQRVNLSAFWKGKPKSEDTKARMRRPKSPEHIAKIQATRKRNREARLALQP